MLIRFFKENDLIGCGGDIQPIRLQVGTLSQSDSRCAHKGCVLRGCAQGLHVQGLRARVVHAGVACAGVVCAGVVGTLNQSVEPIRVAHTGVAHKGCMCRGNLIGCGGEL